MAVDSRDKRFSLLAFGKPVPQVFPNPDGSNWATSSERSAGGLWLYYGISIQAAQPTMLRWGGVPYVRVANPSFGRTW